MSRRPPRSVHLNRALSKLGVLTRSHATRAILDGRVSVDGRVVVDPAAPVFLDRSRIELAGQEARPSRWRTLMLHKPKGVMTTRRDPEGRPTVFDLLDGESQGMVAVGRLDFATSGLLLLTSDTTLAGWLTDPANRVGRTYIVTVRGHVSDAELDRMRSGVVEAGERLVASDAVARKRSARESHLTIELREGRNREVRRLCAAVGHEVTRLKRIKLGGLELGDLPPGHWRELTRRAVAQAFPGCRLRAEPR